MVKESAYNAGDPGSIPGSGRSPGEGHGNPLQYSGLEKSRGPMGMQRVGTTELLTLSLPLFKQVRTSAYNTVRHTVSNKCNLLFQRHYILFTTFNIKHFNVRIY